MVQDLPALLSAADPLRSIGAARRSEALTGYVHAYAMTAKLRTKMGAADLICALLRADRPDDGERLAVQMAMVVGRAARPGPPSVISVERLTGLPPQFGFRAPTPARRADPPAALVVCPATFNTVNRAAAGAIDTYALGQLCEALGMRLPTVSRRW